MCGQVPWADSLRSASLSRGAGATRPRPCVSPSVEKQHSRPRPPNELAHPPRPAKLICSVEPWCLAKREKGTRYRKEGKGRAQSHASVSRDDDVVCVARSSTEAESVPAEVAKEDGEMDDDARQQDIDRITRRAEAHGIDPHRVALALGRAEPPQTETQAVQEVQPRSWLRRVFAGAALSRGTSSGGDGPR